MVELLLLGHNESLKIEAKVAWITPPNALYQVLPGIGVQFIGAQAQTHRATLESSLDKSMEIGGYTVGISKQDK